MAVEKSEPRLGIILTVAVSSIVIFLGLREFLITYFAIETSEEHQVKIGSAVPLQRNHQREIEAQRLENGPVPITQAMQIVAQGARPALITPQPSTDNSAMQGWSQRPLTFVPPAPPAPAMPTPTPEATPPAQAPGGAAAPTNPEQQQTLTGNPAAVPTTGNPPAQPATAAPSGANPAPAAEGQAH